MEELQVIFQALPYVAAIVTVSVGGWVFTTWLKIKNGYPLETSWGQPLHPSSDNEAKERIKLLTGENAQLRAELGSVNIRRVYGNWSKPGLRGWTDVALRYALEKNSYRVREVNLSAAGSDLGLERCDLIVIAAPAAPGKYTVTEIQPAH